MTARLPLRPKRDSYGIIFFLTHKDASAPSIERLSIVFLLLLFPGAFFYHTAIGLNYISPFLNGYISIVGALATAVLMTHATLTLLSKQSIEKRNITFLFFMMLFGGVSAYHYLIGPHTENAQNNLLLFVNLAACYFIFKNINAFDNSYKKTITSLGLAMSAVIIYQSNDGAFDLSAHSENPLSVANYQTIALAYMPPMILAIAKSTSRIQRYILFIIAASCLYLNGARSEFVAILIFFTTFESSLSNRRILEALLVTIATAVTITAVLTFSDESSNNRTLRLANLAEDNSSIVRDQIAQEGLSKIIENPLLGAYGNYEPGLYIHNILSAWQDLGLFGFIYFCLMLAIPLVYFTRQSLLKRQKSKDVALCIGMLAATSVLLLYGKYFAYPLVAITLGMVSSRSRIMKAPHSNSLHAVS
ncbi:O-antigen ligase family protein [Pseudomonas sp. SDO5271_S396]